ncbi:NAD-dependent epimerase/dehydratase family protein [Flagellimonas flava]|uniref:NAD-dependent epimerase/dehydratase family protein n=1 Tax=Flagellimonas flava TaxID=570519 RepID=UPI003D64EF49
MKSKVAIVIGGSGYIGRNLLMYFLQKNRFDQYIVMDIKPLEGFKHETDSGKVEFMEADVRKTLPKIDIKLDGKESWIFNLAAVHREPGHDFKEYFDTNIPGAINVNDLALRLEVENIFFTSSIAPYGRSREQRSELSTLYPETGYGISKAIAEQIHQKWHNHNQTKRRLIIVRPSVIYGPHDPGNVLRMIKALKKGTFVLPNGGKVIKAYGYVFGLVESILFTMDSRKEPLIVYNYAENPLVPLKEMTQIVRKKFGYSRPALSVPTSFLAVIAGIIQVATRIVGKKSDIHPVRVKKASFPTNIKPGFLIESGFDFRYDFEKSLEHWKSVAPDDF